MLHVHFLYSTHNIALLCKVNCVMCLSTYVLCSCPDVPWCPFPSHPLPSHTQGRKIEATPLAMYNLFIERVRQNLHIVLAMSPIGDTFRSRLRMFPSLISCCTIDWFHVSGNLWCACVPPWTMSTVAVRCGMSEVYLVASRCGEQFWLILGVHVPQGYSIWLFCVSGSIFHTVANWPRRPMDLPQCCKIFNQMCFL